MTLEMRIAVVKELCARIEEVILTGLDEETDKFPILSNTINLLNTLDENNDLQYTLNTFVDSFMDLIYDEVRTYMNKP